MSEYEKVRIHNGSLYYCQPGMYCGVLVKESTMRKLSKLQADHLQKVKRLLSDESDKGRVFPYGWTLHYPKGKQTKVTYIDESTDVKDSIASATTCYHPRRQPLVFIASSMNEAGEAADAYWENKIYT